MFQKCVQCGNNFGTLTGSDNTIRTVCLEHDSECVPGPKIFVTNIITNQFTTPIQVDLVNFRMHVAFLASTNFNSRYRVCDMTNRNINNESNRRKNAVYTKAFGIRNKCLGNDSQGITHVFNQRCAKWIKCKQRPTNPIASKSRMRLKFAASTINEFRLHGRASDRLN